MDVRTYNVIKSRIRQTITLNNGYQFDDLCHDTIEKLLKMKKSDNECIKLCVVIALNLIRDHHRKYNRLQTIRLYDTKSDLEEEKGIKIIEPVKYKEIFVLRYKLSMKYKEISDSLNIPMGTVKASISKMHHELKELNL